LRSLRKITIIFCLNIISANIKIEIQTQRIKLDQITIFSFII